MPLLPKKAKKIAGYVLSGVLVAGMICVTGFLSFTGMLLFNPSIYLALTTFFLAGAIEGEVYAQNINASVFKISTSNYWEDLVLKKLLNKLFKHNPSSLFLQECKALQEYIAALEEAHDHGHDHGNSQALELKNAKISLQYKMRYFKDFILSDADTSDTARYPFHPELNEAFATILKKDNKKSDPAAIREEILLIRKQIRRKILLSRLAWILNIGAGISCFLVGLEVAQVSIAAVAMHFGLAISGAALTASVFGLAIVGAIGYTLLIHNTITNMIKDETLRNWVKSTRDFFKRKAEESTVKYALRVIGGSLAVALVVGLGVFATVATAGTWWHAAKAGAKLIPWLSTIASELRAIAVSTMGFTQLLFNVWNSIKSVQELAKRSLYNTWQQLKKTVRRYISLENFAQLLNPFRLILLLITVPFKLAVFIGHLLSMGLMGDNLDNVPPLATTLLATSNEALQDVHYFLPEEEAQGHEHESYDLQVRAALSPGQTLKKTFVLNQHTGELIQFDAKGQQKTIFNAGELTAVLSSLKLSHYATQTPNSPSIKKDLKPEQLKTLNHLLRKKLGHHHKHAHDHHHADLIGKFLQLVLWPLYFLAALWDYDFSQLNHKGKSPLTFKRAYQKALTGLSEHCHHEVEKPRISSSWQNYEKGKRIQAVIAKEAPTLPSEDKKVLEDLEKQLKQQPTTTPPVTSFNSATLLKTFEENTTLKAKDRTRKIFSKVLDIAASGLVQAEPAATPTKKTPDSDSPTQASRKSSKAPFFTHEEPKRAQTPPRQQFSPTQA